MRALRSQLGRHLLVGQHKSREVNAPGIVSVLLKHSTEVAGAEAGCVAALGDRGCLGLRR